VRDVAIAPARSYGNANGCFAEYCFGTLLMVGNGYPGLLRCTNQMDILILLPD